MDGRRWDEARDALLDIAQYAQDLNVRSVSLRFMNNNIYDRGIQVRFIIVERPQTDVSQGRDAIMSRFEGIMPIGTK